MTPARQAKLFEDQGFQYLHVVDLNGAIEGKPVNGAAVAGILEAVSIPVQLGGGIRDMATIAHWLEAGVRRVILGTAALKDPELLRRAAQAFPNQVAVGIDARDGQVAIEGWATATSLPAIELARRQAELGVGGHHLHRYCPRRRA